MYNIKGISDALNLYSKPSVPYETYESNLYSDKTKNGLKYLIKQRGLNAETLQHFHIGLTENDEIAIPIFKDGHLVDYKFRSIHNKIWHRHPNSETWILNEAALYNENKYLIAVEGEIDAMSLWQLGFKNVISITGGAQGRTPWVAKIPDDIPVYLNYDNDEPGQDAAQELAEKLGLERCFKIKFKDVKDANEFLTKGGSAEEYQKLIDTAEKFSIKDVLSIDELIDNLRNNKLQRVETFSERLTNKLDGGIPSKSLVTISGRTGVGKSTVLTNMLVKHADDGHPVLLVSLENDLYLTVQRVLEVKYNKKHTEFTEEDWARIKKEMLNYPFYIDISMESYSMYKIEKIIKQAKKLFGIKFFGMDHIGFVPARDDAQHISQMVREFKLLSRNNDIIIYMISHVRKSNADDYLTSEELKGSSSIAQDSDIVLLLVDTRAGLEISIDKARMSKSKLRIPLLFNGNTGKMEDDVSRSIKHYDDEIEG